MKYRHGTGRNLFFRTFSDKRIVFVCRLTTTERNSIFKRSDRSISDILVVKFEFDRFRVCNFILTFPFLSVFKERFLAGEAIKKHRYAYFPFGGGPRRCIGSSFAMMEAQIILATVTQKYSLRLTRDPVEVEASVTLRPRHGIQMTVHKI